MSMELLESRNPADNITSPVLRMVLLEEAKLIVATKYPAIYYEPELRDPVIPDRDLTDEEEAERQRQFAEAEDQHAIACVIADQSRQRFLDLEMARLYRRYLRESQKLERVMNAPTLAAGVSQWLERQRRKGTFARTEARMFLYLMIKAAIESDDAGASTVDPKAWGAESFQDYVTWATATYDGGDDEPDQLFDLMTLRRCRSLMA